ncbi:MAG TPA: glycosyltransferase family 39 protein [Candidatus Nanopelagicales bacterium]|nr:glycosyltransferase family 39 protein [Candidatus Nanopelagicales bacterium]
MARRLGVLAFVALVLGVLVAGVVQARDDSPTYDEPVYVSAGLLALTQHDLDYNAEHPPLPKAVAALPVLLTPYVLPPGHADGTNDERTYSAVFLQAQGGALGAVTLASRIVPLLELVLVAGLLVLLGRQLVSLTGGLIAGALWLVSPMSLGLGHLDGVDLPFTVAVCVYAGALLHARHHDDRRSTVMLGVALGLCFATSALAIPLALVTGVLLVVQRRRRGLLQWLLVGAVAWAVLWASYLVLDPPVLLDSAWLLPRPYVDGLMFLRENDTVPAYGYLLGHSWVGGQWWFWPGSLLVKLTTPVLLVLVLAPLCWRLVEGDRRRDAAVVLLVPAVALLAVVMLSPRDLGVRYLLPVLALWCVAAAPLAILLQRRWAQVASAVAALVAVVMLASSLPHSLAYTSPPFVPAYRVATDSNVDWGQDLRLLQQWAPGRSPYVAWFGPRGTSYADVPGARSLDATPVGDVRGWVAVSATRLTSAAPDRLSWLRAYCSVGTLGGSVVLYRFDEAPTDAPGPTAPAGPCTGSSGSIRQP